MTARLANLSDVDYIRRKLLSRGQNYADSAIQKMATSPRFLTVVAPPTGLFWLCQDEADLTLLHAGLTFSSGPAQTIEMLRLMLALNPWPNWKLCRVQADPAVCSADAQQAITDVAKMSVVGQVGKAKVYEITKATLLKNLGVKP